MKRSIGGGKYLIVEEDEIERTENNNTRKIGTFEFFWSRFSSARERAGLPQQQRAPGNRYFKCLLATVELEDILAGEILRI